MKTNFYKRLLDGEDAAKVLIDAAETSKTDFSQDAAELDGNEIVQFSLETIKNVRTYGTEYTLLVGMLLEMHRQLTLKEQGIFTNVLADLGMSRTQAYRVIAVWKRCGQQLTKTPALTAMFVPEALKLLCEAKVPEAARTEAFELAVNGKQINIQQAKNICTKHVPEDPKQSALAGVKKLKRSDAKQNKSPSENDKSNNAKPKGRRSLLSFVGDFARLVVQAKGETVDIKAISKPVLANVIRDTEKFLAEMRRQHALMNDKSTLTKAG